MDRLHRLRLLIGENAIAKLQHSTVMVVGCGAVGSFAIEALARSGVGHIILIDFDKVEESNINRQLFALGSTVGIPKVTVAKQRIFDINPTIKVDVLNLFFDENTILNCENIDYVIDAIDIVKSKISLYQWCTNNNIPLISSMGAARKTDITKIKIDKISKTSVCPLASKIRHSIRGLNLSDFDVVYSTEVAAPQYTPGREFGSSVSVTGAFGLFLANFVIKKLSA